MSEKGLQLTERDYDVIRLVYRFRFCMGRHIKELAGFNGTRATDRRLKLLVEAKYLERKKYLYGVPYLYTVAHKGRILIEVNKRADKIRVDRITHDTHVLDAVCYFVKKYGFTLADIITEKEMHANDGFGNRRHYPDFILIRKGKLHAVEIEISLKSKERLYKNGKDNFLIADNQIWVVNKGERKLTESIEQMKEEYPNIAIIYLEDVLNYVSRNNGGI